MTMAGVARPTLLHHGVRSTSVALTPAGRCSRYLAARDPVVAHRPAEAHHRQAVVGGGDGRLGRHRRDEDTLGGPAGLDLARVGAQLPAEPPGQDHPALPIDPDPYHRRW